MERAKKSERSPAAKALVHQDETAKTKENGKEQADGKFRH